MKKCLLILFALAVAGCSTPPPQKMAAPTKRPEIKKNMVRPFGPLSDKPIKK